MKLIGGATDDADLLPATVFVHELTCAATRIGPRHLLTAAHCLIDSAETFYEGPTKGQQRWVRKPWLQGAQLHVTNARVPAGRGDFQTVTVADVRINDAFWRECREHCDWMNSAPYLPDAAILVLKEELAGVPIAAVNTETLAPGAEIVLAGYGCELGHMKAQPEWNQHRRKFLRSVTVSPEDVLGAVPEAKAMSASYVLTAGIPEGSDDTTAFEEAALCPGDSGGPLYVERAGRMAVAGVNSSGRWRVGSTKARIPQVNLHTRLDGQGAFQANEWLKSALREGP